jgi:dolichyl-phosphate-mannose-protein mannosyltransferase
MNDAWFSQNVNVEPNTTYLLTGWIKTQNVAYGAGANFCLAGTWTHTEGVFGTRDWTFVRLLFNSGSDTQINIGARLGYWDNLSAGTAWFDDLRLTPLRTDDPHPRG